MNFLLTKLLCLLVGFFTGCIAPVLIKSHASTKVRTPYGEIRGLLVELPHSAHLKSVEAYFGLQFASIRSPSGSLRFSVPNTPKERWNTIKYINETNVPTCPQRKFKLKELNRKWPAAVVEKIQNITSFVRDVTEDCLRFNIYVPTTGKNFIYIAFGLIGLIINTFEKLKHAWFYYHFNKKSFSKISYSIFFSR